MKIVIMAGGTGSISLQAGLDHLFRERGISEVDVKVIVNAYDNGLSTGAVRNVLSGHILGPSDVRKNQSTRAGLATTSSPPLSVLLDHRFSVETPKAREYVIKQIADSKIDTNKKKVLLSGVEAYFDQPLSARIDYTDFSLANIIYAGLASLNGNSLRSAARIMADVLEIPDNVILNDDKSLFLGAITKSGERITDEGDIVSWNNPNDPIVDVFFTDSMGDVGEPVLCDEAKQTISEADVIILSSGTQWSSLIPTYASKGFRNAMENFRGRLLMVMNRVPDKDAPDQGADDIIRTIVPKYFPENRIDLIIDSTGPEQMRSLRGETVRDLLRSVNTFDLEWYHTMPTKHNPAKLGAAVVKTIFRDYLGAAAYMFDYDDTLVGRGNTFAQSSATNKRLLTFMNNKTNRVAICTGNSIKAINIDAAPSFLEHDEKNRAITIYADGGVNKYEYNTAAREHDEEIKPFSFIECVAPDAQFAETGSHSAAGLTSALRLAGIPTNKIENRGNVMLSIKPVDPEYREIVRQLALRVVTPMNPKLKVKSAGRTTVEIATDLVTKKNAVLQMLEKHCTMSHDTLVFVGDEFDYGNDRDVALLAETDKRIKCLKVNSPADTALFLTALTLSNG